MNVVVGCLLTQHDLRLVPVAAVLCFFACATALALMARALAASRPLMRRVWSMAGGTVSATGIWAPHFIAILAYNSGMPVAFDPGLTLLSVAVAVVLCCVAAALVAADPAAGFLGGLLCGVAIAAMHYLGMAAVELPADPVWNRGLVAASVLMGVSLSGLAGWFAPRDRLGCCLAVLLFSLAILTLHFTGMAAVRFLPDPARTVSGITLEPFALAVIVAAGAAFVVGLALVMALVDHYLADRARGEAERMRRHIAELEAARAGQEKAAADLSAALEAAEAASRTKSAFLAAMSHELRTPLNAVIGFSEMMLAEAFGPLGSPRYHDYLNDIRASGAHLLSVINDILDLSRLDAGQGVVEAETFDLGEEIAATLRMVAPQAAKAKVALASRIAPDLPLLKADRRRIVQILLNLLSNALKFTPPGGAVTVRAMADDEGLRLSVSDTGIGIAAEDIPKALEPFGQVDSSLARKYDGTGLGLPLTRRMAELHGGSLVLDSAPGQGTIVTVRLPAWRLAEAAA